MEHIVPYPPKRVILLPSSIRTQALKDYAHEEEEWSTGVPAAILVSKTFTKELFCAEWNRPVVNTESLRAGHVLIPKYSEIDIIQLDGSPMRHARFERNERLFVKQVGYDQLMEQFVFRANDRLWLPVDWEMFDLRN